MTDLQRATIRASEIRTRLAELGGLDTLEDEQRSELESLRAEYADVERRTVALTIAGSETTTETTTEATETRETAEGRELRELRERVDFEPYLSAALAGTGVTVGAEAELNQHMGIPAHHFPTELLAGTVEHREDGGNLETRAAIDGDGKANQGSWIDRMFADTAAARLGVSMPSVAAGIAAYPVIASNATPAQRGRTQASTGATITAAVTEVSPTRKAVHAIFSIEDDARLPGLADAIMRDLRAAMVERVDRTIFLGDSTANENTADITGFRTAANITEATLSQANKVKGVDTVKAFADMVDGIYAGGFGDMSIVSAIGAWRLWESTVLPTPVTTGQTIASYMRAAGLSWTARGSIETATSNGDFGAFVGLQRGIANAAVAPVWEGAQLIRDPYSGATKGEVSLSLHYLWGFKIPRTANWRRLKFVS